jgi:acyl-CoA reductase-like NAD-dependent aldehyde dehydrogenase
MTATLGSYGLVRSTETFDSLNPATNEVIGTYPIFNARDVAATVERAQAAAQWWADLG